MLVELLQSMESFRAGREQHDSAVEGVWRKTLGRGGERGVAEAADHFVDVAQCKCVAVHEQHSFKLD